MSELELLGGAVACELKQSNEDYHASPGVSTSRLKVFMDDPRLYWWQFISGKHEKVSKPCFDFGSATHGLLFGGAEKRVVRIPSSVLNATGGKSGKQWKDFEAENADAILLKDDEYESLYRCADAVMSHPVAGKLIGQPGRCERSFCAYDRNLELLTRCKPDKLLDSGIVVDLKTTSGGTKASKFVKAITSFGYHYQEHFYRRVLSACNVNVKAFIFVVVNVEPPFTVDCFTLSNEFLFLAEVDVENALLDLAERTRADNWDPRSNNSIQELSPPNYLKYKGEYDL